MVRNKKAAKVTKKFPKNKILETRELQGDYIILDALLDDEEQYTVDEAVAIVAAFKNREVK